MADSSIKEKDIETPRDVSPEVGEVSEIDDGDAALQFLRRASKVAEMTRADEKKLVRKIDLMIMPLMWCCYCLQYLDKTL
ncbi:hypothetical protein LTR28_009472, partial [Elasticomyces elasticus]